jgi:DNA-binding Xre family transcriptional regulator
MKIQWKLRMAAAQREVWTGTQMRRLLAEKAGLDMSAASVSALFTKEPSQVKLSTLAALCTALECTPTTCSTSTPPRSSNRPDRLGLSPNRRKPSPTAAGPCHRCDDRGQHRRLNGSVTAWAAVPRSGSLTGSTAAGACAARPRPPRRQLTRDAGINGSCRPTPASASPAPEPASNVAIPSGTRTRHYAGTADARPGSELHFRTALAAAGPDCCARRPDGADTAPDPARANNHPHLRRMRAASTPWRSGIVHRLPTTPPRPALHPRRQPRREIDRTIGLAGRLHRSPCRPA